MSVYRNILRGVLAAAGPIVAMTPNKYDNAIHALISHIVNDENTWTALENFAATFYKSEPVEPVQPTE